MGLIELKKGEVLHRAGSDKVDSLEIIIKGSMLCSNQFTTTTFGVGGIIGLPEIPGQYYKYTYQASEDTSVFSYPYTSRDDIYKTIKANPKISSILASQSIKIADNVCKLYDEQFDMCMAEYDKIQADYKDFPMLCVEVGNDPVEFPEIDKLSPPVKMQVVAPWQKEFMESLVANEAKLKKGFYNLAPELAIGMVMTTVEINVYVTAGVDKLLEYKKDLDAKAGPFLSAFHLVKAKSDEIKRSTDGDDASPIAITNALNTILQYSDADPEYIAQFRDAVTEFKNTPGRYDSSDESRKLRRNLATHFYDIYVSAFLKSINDPDVPSEVKMFFMFGFVDEELAGEEYTAFLYKLMKVYKPDPKGKVVTIYEWLLKIYKMELEPSRNEFDEDYPTSLRSAKLNGEITAEQVETLQNDPTNRLKFEAKNLFALSNRMTFGRVSSFVPVFDSVNVMRDLDSSYMSAEKITGYFDSVKAVDFTVFCRDSIYANSELGISQLYITEDVDPYMILMPNVGSRASLWQEIEGKKRNTPARMVISIFNTENVEESIIKLCGEFRWEMCKTIQGVHWNDVTDPSLTSMYCDYLQFYKKNRSLSTENKEKIKTALQKNNNNYKNVFVGDYFAFMKFEANGSPRLNKLAREILFTYCPFSAEYREKMADNPQFGQMISQYKNHINGVARPLILTIKRLQKDEIEVPEVLMRQYEHYKH